MKVVFISVPSKGTTNGGALTSAFCEDMAILHEQHPDHVFLSPMLQNMQIVPYMQINPIWKDWDNYCRAIINRCDEMWVLKYHGWDTSEGVKHEILHANKKGIPVIFKEPR